jgi:hypothetical protein
MHREPIFLEAVPTLTRNSAQSSVRDRIARTSEQSAQLDAFIAAFIHGVLRNAHLHLYPTPLSAKKSIYLE